MSKHRPKPKPRPRWPDLLLYGNAFEVEKTGERIDPRGVRPGGVPSK